MATRLVIGQVVKRVPSTVKAVGGAVVTRILRELASVLRTLVGSLDNSKRLNSSPGADGAAQGRFQRHHSRGHSGPV